MKKKLFKSLSSSLFSFTFSFTLLLSFSSLQLSAQVEERPRPAEWANLITGGRFMDRLLPMPEGRTRRGVWGTKEVQNRFVDNGLELKDFSFWGGNILEGEDGDYHLFVAGWPENSPNGHMFWSNSTVYHAVADNPFGPFIVQNSVGKGHNPEAFRLDDGRVVVYVIDGYYIADGLNSKVWTYGQFSFDSRGHNIIEGLSNLTFTRRQDGSFLMVCRGGGVWVSRDGLSPYEQLTDCRVYPDIDGRFEDPVVWRDSLQYHLIVNDWLGRIAYYERSLDGLHWIVEPGEAYMPGVSRHRDGSVEEWFKYERPKIRQDEYGRACQINFAVIDTIKWEDQPLDRHSSKNISVPMNPGLCMEVLNSEPITAKTKNVRLRIKAEKGFAPAEDLDLGSVVFGSYEDVNYGRGAKVVKSEKDGDDLILTFRGKDCNLPSGEWAPKLIGKKKDGSMVFGYARLPYIDYTPAVLSASRPEKKKDRQDFVFTVKNYGLTSSQPSVAEVISEEKVLSAVQIPSLRPYESVELILASDFPKNGRIVIR